MSRPCLTQRRLVITTALALAASSAWADDAYPDGAAGFAANCAVCHGPAATGIPALAPPLTRNPARYAGDPQGRRQLAMTVLYGLWGEIMVDGKKYDFRMTDFTRLDDATLAAILNHVVFDVDKAPAGVKPLTAADIAAERAHPIDGTGVREHRKSLPAALTD
ncbi:MAG: cytochrome c [Proteobacteria bacterium]|nr:cytochrome c [Pseudomonadota bacterium]